MPESRAHIFVSGHVQGVFFRAAAAETADGLDLCGWVRNLSDGRVEIVAEGNKEAARRLIDWCYEGPPAAQVAGVEIQWETPTGEFTTFEQKHTF
ncbi:MAG: acylphosphatase [Actinomycetota bacterium]